MISIVINCDTRDGFQSESTSASTMFEGCRSMDFLVDGIINKIKFFDGFEKEVILFVDEHNPIPEEVMWGVRQFIGVTTLAIRKHTNENSFNDLNYLRALQLASGDIVVHFDQDTAAFARNPLVVDDMIKLLQADIYDYISYPSKWSPRPVDDPSFDYDWISTRFFMCKKETLNFPEIYRCLKDADYFNREYAASRHCNWLEHILGRIAKYRNQSMVFSNPPQPPIQHNKRPVFYPPMDLDNYAIFSWSHYKTGTLAKLNDMPYDEVKAYIEAAGGVNYPCDVNAI